MRSVLWMLLLIPLAVLLVTWTQRVERRSDELFHATPHALVGPIQVVSEVYTVPPVAARQVNRRAPKPTRPEVNDSPLVLLTVEGGGRKTRDEAYTDALEQASIMVHEKFNLRHVLPPEFIEKMVVNKTESMVDTQTTLGEVPKYTLDLEIKPEHRREMAKFEREHRVHDRMLWLSRMLAIAVVGLGAVSAYVRLDDWSKGYITGALKFVAVVAVIGTGIGVWFW